MVLIVDFSFFDGFFSSTAYSTWRRWRTVNSSFCHFPFWYVSSSTLHGTSAYYTGTTELNSAEKRVATINPVGPYDPLIRGAGLVYYLVATK